MPQCCKTILEKHILAGVTIASLYTYKHKMQTKNQQERARDSDVIISQTTGQDSSMTETSKSTNEDISSSPLKLESRIGEH